MIGQNEQLQSFQDRFRYLYGILIVMASILFLRLWYLQILKGEEFNLAAEENRLKKIKLEAPRGMVFDRDRRILLDNHPTFNVVITPQYFRAAPLEAREATISKLSRILNTNSKTIMETLTKARNQPSFQPVAVKKNLSMDEVSLIEMEKLSMPGVEVATGIRRTNVNGLIGSHLLGYIAEVDADELPRVNKSAKRAYSQGDSIGKSGLEMQWENVLRGVDGVEFVEVDAFGRKKQANERSNPGMVFEIPSKPAEPGRNIVLTVDEDLQTTAAEAFQKDNRTGSMVAIDPNNGEVLGMLSWPSFDPAEFSVGIRPEYYKQLISNDDKPLRDKTILDHYQPGSTFKIISSIAGLEEGLINENTVVNAGWTFKFGSHTFHDWKVGGHGPTDVIKSLYRSVDVFYYKLGTHMEIDVLARYARNLGLGTRTGIQLPGEIPGLVPDVAWKRRTQNAEWYPGETLSVMIGQGALTATPVQLANMIATVANGGTIYRPRLVKYIEGQDGSILDKSEPEVIHTAKFSADTLRLVRKGLQLVLEHDNGTAHAHFVPGIEAAGKTGTAQVVKYTADTLNKDCMHMERKYRNNGLFVAYAPVDDPKIAVAVVLEHGCHGTAAAPIAMAVVKKFLQKLDPQKYSDETLKLAREAYWKKRAASIRAQQSSEE
ncbi:MAG TPA: penicillin-binding protein 2 [Bdellovibrionota bacterium]|jgi:penicillin-binding protein 2